MSAIASGWASPNAPLLLRSNRCKVLMKKLIKILLLIFISLLWGTEVQAGQLAERVSKFPDWNHKPVVQVAEGDLIYPQWMEGEWEVTSTLIDMVAPLAPTIMTPGFESNRQYLNQPIQFKVRFKAVNLLNSLQSSGSSSSKIKEPSENNNQSQIYPPIVSDRAFNGLNIGKAIVGENGILAVKEVANDPNRQITLLKGAKLTSTVTNRGSETPNSNEFISTEISQQVFETRSQIYLNEVETTTAYTANLDQTLSTPQAKSIVADQITAIYLSPQDPNFFAASGHPVALYRYQLQLERN